MDNILQVIDARTQARGQVELPCIPAACEHFVERLHRLFATLGKDLADNEIGQLRDLISAKLAEGWRQSMSSRLLVRYEIAVTASLQMDLSCNVSVVAPTLDEQFRNWLQNASAQPFGTHADARILDVAKTLGTPSATPVLDVGAGSGRNAIPLAKLGHPVEAVERSSEMVDLLQANARTAGVEVGIAANDFLEAAADAPSSRYRLIIASEFVTHMRDTEELRRFLVRSSALLEPAGRMVFNIFLWHAPHEPSELVRQTSRFSWASLFTRGELDEAISDLPLAIAADDSAAAYEQAHLPQEAWPPTPWFESWAMGRSIFPNSKTPPYRLRWFECVRTGK